MSSTTSFVDEWVRRAGRPASRAFPPHTPHWIVALAQRIRGHISVPGMPNYDAARAGTSALYPARPAAVVFCATEQDVRMALWAAQDAGVALRLRSGRHSLIGESSVDDGLVIDVRQLRDIAIDHAARTATIGAGATLDEVNATLGACMLHVPAGTWPTVGIAGFMQGGGYGRTSRKYGMNCDLVAEVRVMLADGRIVRASHEVNSSLLWAVRGGAGGNFGILLDVTYDAAELYDVWGFMLQWPIDDAPEVLAAMQEGYTRHGDAPDDLGFVMALRRVDASPILVMSGIFTGDRRAGIEAIASLREIGACAVTMDVTAAWTAINARLANAEALNVDADASARFAHRSGYVVRPLGVDGWGAVVEQFKAAPGPNDVALLFPHGGRVSRIPASDCAFVHRAVDMNAYVCAGLSPEGEDNADERAWLWANGLLDLLAPFRDGSVYQNYPERDLLDYRSAYWGENFGALLAIKRIVDPDDVFTQPQGVSPDPSAPAREPLPELEPESIAAIGHGASWTGPSALNRDGGAVVERSEPHSEVPMPSATSELHERLAELSDLGRAGAVLVWDQHVMMPSRGGSARGAILGTLERVGREKLVGSELSTLLALGDPRDPLVRVIGRDQERLRRVPARLTEDIARAGAEGMDAWLDARALNDYRRFEPALRRNVELAREYAGCFPESAHPYDPLLDRYEPGATTVAVRALLERICTGLAPLHADLAARSAPAALTGPFPVESQRELALEIAAAMGFDADGYRLDMAVHPFACAPAPSDVRVAARFEEDSLSGLFTFLHEMGHALYERGIDPALARTGLDVPASIGVHESQSRLWENLVGRGEPFWSWWLPRLRQAMPAALADVALDDFMRAINVVRPTLIRIDADEVTYALHVLLRFELEIGLVEGTLDPSDLPVTWAQRTYELLGIDVPDDVRGVLQDVHWAQGIIGYFPTYAIGNVLAAQLWEVARAEVSCLEDDLRAGDYRSLREWLRERVHRYGRTLLPAEVVARAVGGSLDPGPLLAYLDAKYRALYGLR